MYVCPNNGRRNSRVEFIISYTEIVAEAESEMVFTFVCTHFGFCLPSLCESLEPGKSAQVG